MRIPFRKVRSLCVKERGDGVKTMADTSSWEYTYCFDTEYYLKTRFSDLTNGRTLFPLQCFHDAFQSLPSSLKVLDYGTGPAIMSVISASRNASEIVLSDYGESNREALKKWLRKDATAFDWSPYFDHVVQKLEGKGEKEAREREERLREVVKDVAYCNINEDPPIRTACQGPYDVVIESACLPASCFTREDFANGVNKLAALLKPGGSLLSYALERKMDTVKGVYYPGTKSQPVLNVIGEYAVGVLKQHGFSDITLQICTSDIPLPYRGGNELASRFITAKKT